MVSRKNLILSSVFLFACGMIWGFNAPEYDDVEFFVDEKSVSFEEKNIYDYLNSSNYVLISGGCYNVEWLATGDLLKLSIPLSNSTYFRFIKTSLSRIEMNNEFFGFGLTWELNKYINFGFIANPVFSKREADFSITMGFNGYNTKNEIQITLRNFDNNYAHKNNNDRYPFPRIYTYPYIPFNSTTYFPVDVQLITTGFIKNNEFYLIFITGTGSKADYFSYDGVLGDVYRYSADSASIYMKTGIMNDTEFNNVSIRSGIALSGMSMQNALFSVDENISEDDRRILAEFNTECSFNDISIPFSFEYYRRFVDTYSVNEYDISSFTLTGGIEYSFSKWDFELIEIYNKYNSFYLQDSLLQTESRLQLSVKYKFSDNAFFLVRKGFETDPRDIKSGGIFFFYDKMYVQFVFDMDLFLKERQWIDLL